MKKTLALLAIVAIAFSSMAQSADYEQMKREWRQKTQMRDYSKQIKSHIPLAPATKGAAKM